MRLKKFIKFIIKWRLPYSNKVIITEYLMSVPRGIKKSHYSRIANGMRRKYKLECFLKRCQNANKHNIQKS